MKRLTFTLVMAFFVAFSLSAQKTTLKTDRAPKEFTEGKIQKNNYPVNTKAPVFTETFSSGTLPAGWQNIDNAGNGFVWVFNNPGSRIINSTTGATGFAIADSDNLGNVGGEDCDLITPAIDCSALTAVKLKFEHYFYSGYGGAAAVSVSGDNGANWTLLESWGPTSTANAAVAEYDITAVAAGQAQVKIKWNWTGDWSWYWAIDDVEVGPPPSDDAGVVSINIPSIIRRTANNAFTPKATVKNFGIDPATFDVTFTSGTFTSVKTVTALAGGTETEVTFDPWTPAVGNNAMSVTTALAGDGNASNNTANKNMYNYIFATTGGLVWDNGPFITDPGAGAGGLDASVVQGGSFGYNYNNNLYRVVEDFTVPTGETWVIDKFVTYGYQTGSTTTSTFTGAYFKVWDRNPTLPGAVCLVDNSATNKQTATTFSNVYRVSSSAMGGTTRPIMENTCEFTPADNYILTEGTYWVEWGATGSLASGPWAVPVSITGGVTYDNALITDLSVYGAAAEEFAFKIYAHAPDPSLKEILAFNIPGQVGPTIIDNIANFTVDLKMPYGYNLTALTPTIVVSPLATISPASGVAQDFSSPVVYTVTAGNSTTQPYMVSVTYAPNTAAEITSFSFGALGVNGTINSGAGTIQAIVPLGTDVTALVPTIALSYGATVNPASGVAQDFTNPVTYVVTAEDGVTTKNWTVTVIEGSGYDINFTVTDGTNPLENVEITVEGMGTFQTDANGQVSVTVPDGSYEWTAILAGYIPQAGTVVVNGADEDVTVVMPVEPAPTVLFFDDFESGIAGWVLASNKPQVWGLNSTHYYSPTNSMTESPTGNYVANLISSATMANGVDLSTAASASITFWAKYKIEAGFDFMYLDVSADNFATYNTIAVFDGQNPGWPTTFNEYTFKIGGFVGQNNVKARFRFESDGGLQYDGMYIDDFEITTRAVDDCEPLIVSAAPVDYEGTINDYIVEAEIRDYSGIREALVYYVVDGDFGNMQTVNGVNTSGNHWEFTIPAQAPGANVWYVIYAQDNSPLRNEGESGEMEYISGNYIAYDNGVVDYINSFGPASTSGQMGAAVKITLLNTDLVTMLIKNYMDENNTNNDIQVHVWDNNGGVPGNDLITPFMVTPEANPANPYKMTRVDLRPFAAQLSNLSGDYFIGFTVPAGQAWITQTTPAIANRSYSFDGSAWTLETDDWHFRAIVSAMPDIVGPAIANTTVPEGYASGLTAQTVVANITDASGIDPTSVKINYTVDGVAQAPITGTNTSGNTYSFTIPQQAYGAWVEYTIEASDNAPTPNTSTSPVYKYIQGQYWAYDNGEVNYYNTLGPDGGMGVNHLAIKMDINPGMVTDLVTMLVRNYYANNTPNADMLVHIWADNNGLPGTDLITPFAVPSEVTSSSQNLQFTRIDLRPYSAQLSDISGTVFFGIEVPTGQVAVLLTSPGVFNRTYTTQDGIDWMLIPTGDDYHMRMVTSDLRVANKDVVSVDALNIYPNPAKDVINVQSNETINSVKLIDMFGKTVTSYKVAGNSTSINTANVNPGVYMLQIETKGGLTTKKVQVVK